MSESTVAAVLCGCYYPSVLRAVAMYMQASVPRAAYLDLTPDLGR